MPIKPENRARYPKDWKAIVRTLDGVSTACARCTKRKRRARSVSEHTRPERAAEFAIARRHLAKVLADPCGHCKLREVAFGIARCQKFGRTFPLCTKTPGLQFEIDHSTLRGTK